MSRRRLRIGVILAVVLLGAYFAVSLAVGRYAAGRLAERLRVQYGMELRWSWAWYHLPMGLALHNVSITVPAPGGHQVQLLRADYFRADLQSSPQANQPVRIAHLVLFRPCLRIDRQANGIVLRPQSPAQPANAPPARAFSISDAQIHDARLEYHNDLSDPADFVSELPEEVFMECSRQPGEPIRFTVHSHPEPMIAPLKISAAGAIDMSDRQLTLDHLTIAGSQDVLLLVVPAQIADRLRITPGLASVKLSVAGTLGLDRPADNNWSGTLALDDVSAYTDSPLPIRHMSVQLALHSSTVPGVLVTAAIQHADADTDGASLHMDSGSLEADADGWKVADLLGWLDMHGSAPAGDPTIRQKFFDRWQLRGRMQFTAAASAPYRLPAGQNVLESVWHDVLAYPRDVAFRAPGFPQSFERIGGGSITLRAGIVSFDHLRGKYGDDTLLLDSARLILQDPRQRIPLSALHRQIELTDMRGAILFAPKPPEYPRYLVKPLADLSPVGAFGLSGTIIFPVRQWGWMGPLHPISADYNLTVSSTGDGQMTLFGRGKVQSIIGSANLTPSAITIARAQGVMFRGTLSANGQIRPDRANRATRFKGEVTASDMQLAELAAAVGMKPAMIERLAGLAGMHATVTDTVVAGKPWYDRLRGNGEFEAYDGAFAALPVISDIAEHKHPAPPTTRAAVAAATSANSPAATNTSAPAPLTVDEAAGLFSLDDHHITFQQLAISSPMVGLEGTGTIGYDRLLDLHLVVVPLGDWKDRAKQANIPIVSDVAGDLLGVVQKVINVAQGTLINAVHVGGTLAKPIVQDIPAPALTDGLKTLFGQMLQPHQDHRLLDAIGGKSPPGTNK